MKCLNPSASVRRAWFNVAQDHTASLALPDVAMFLAIDGRMFPAWKSTLYEALGSTNVASQFWDIYAQLDGFEVIEGDIVPLDPSLNWANGLVFTPTNWVTDDLTRLIPKIAIKWTGANDYEDWQSVFSVESNNPARQWWKHTGRVGKLVIDVHMKISSFADVIEFVCEFDHSDPSTEELEAAIDSIRLTFGEPFVVDRNGRGHGPVMLDPSGDSYTVELLPEPTVMGDGQMLMPVYGAVLATDNSVSLGSLLVSGQQGVQDRMRDLMARLDGRVEASPGPTMSWLHFGALAKEHPMDFEFKDQEFQRGALELQNDAPWWDSYRSLLPSSGATGSQRGFGAAKLTEVSTWDDPRFFPHLRATVEAALRPYHYREMDGSRVLKADHPDWWTWSQKTHYHPSASPDRLGKPGWWPPFETHGWGGKDDQHMDDNHLNGLTACFECPVLLSIMKDSIQSSIANVRNKAQGATGPSPRALGRRAQADAGRWMLTGDESLWTMMEQMHIISWREALGRDLPIGLVRPQSIMIDPRKLLDPETGMPWATLSIWEHGIQCAGLAAHHSVIEKRISLNLPVVTGDFLDLYKMVAETVILWGVWRGPSGNWRFAQDIHYLPDGLPMNFIHYLNEDPGWIQPAGVIQWGGWTDWVFPGLLYLDQVVTDVDLTPHVRETLESHMTQLMIAGNPESLNTREWFATCDWSLPD